MIDRVVRRNMWRSVGRFDTPVECHACCQEEAREVVRFGYVSYAGFCVILSYILDSVQTRIR